MKSLASSKPILIIGSGIAGLSAAISLAEQGFKSLVITAAADLPETNTAYAQGGIIYQGDDPDSDSRALENDIIKAGANVNYLPAVKQLIEEGPRLVEEVLLKKAKVPFDKDENQAHYHLTREGGHSATRIIHRADESGRAIEEALLSYAKTLPEIEFLSGATAVNLLMTSFHASDRSIRHGEARCFGAFVFFQKTRMVEPIFSAHTVLATGGIGQLFLHSTNGKFSRGDGIALAHRAGCRLENLEYVQFHPTTFFQATGPRFLISESLRGEGAYLINQKGERFLTMRLPGLATPELAPRDKVAQAIHEEMLATGAPCVFLSISHKPAAWIKERFPFIYKSCLRFGIDMTKEPIPVVPGAHYHCGGIWTDLSGRTSVANLWAAGEVACTGLHGANRLASTSLLEGLVWGSKAGESIATALENESAPIIPEIEPWKSETGSIEPSFLTQDWLTLKHTMWNYVGLIKTDLRLERAQGILGELSRGIDQFYRHAALSDELIGLRHASLVARLVVEASLRNRRSLGCYLRDENSV
ncbi:MAG: L-aspartate oxidase [Proteobacteria bacterium]|nr:L-aspartate oxidase [Pseudomonadota bacterium]